MLIKNAKLVDEVYDAGVLYDIYIENGVIQKIGNN